MRCDVESGDLVQGFQLIDCNSSNTVTATRDVEYVALSYVLGPCAQDDTQDNKKLLWDRLPHTIRDAIKVKKRLGYRYLWVDR